MIRQRHLFALLVCAMVATGCQHHSATSHSATSSSEHSDHDLRILDQTVEASCGQCQFGMDGDGCDLAVRIDGASYYVDGTSIDDHGDAHADDGMCNCIRTARISGEIIDGRFAASSFELLPLEKQADDESGQ